MFDGLDLFIAYSTGMVSVWFFVFLIGRNWKAVALAILGIALGAVSIAARHFV